MDPCWIKIDPYQLKGPLVTVYARYDTIILFPCHSPIELEGS